MGEVLDRFATRLRGHDGKRYAPQACGRPIENGRLWEGWIEFVPDVGGAVLRTRRETEQPNRMDLLYWASGLSAVYLEGAFSRAISPAREARRERAAAPVYPGPASEEEDGRAAISRPVRVRAVLDPFRAARQGQDILAQELRALDAAHLRNIVRAYELVDPPSADLQTLTHAELAALIKSAVRERLAGIAEAGTGERRSPPHPGATRIRSAPHSAG